MSLLLNSAFVVGSRSIWFQLVLPLCMLFFVLFFFAMDPMLMHIFVAVWSVWSIPCFAQVPQSVTCLKSDAEMLKTSSMW